MQARILKFALNYGINTVQLPVGSKAISVGTQQFGSEWHFRVWCLVPVQATGTENRVFHVIRTGAPFEFKDDESAFLGTIFVDNGQGVFHVFEDKAATVTS